ncbi:MAG: hypothetical protein E6J85_07965 [Deltaproteobacteria bacterium]|nr:MAG: hypothetical protein E6J85_07965 [Deltaproteobacteria bacterium]
MALAAVYFGPVVFLLATAVLVVGLWKGWNLGGVLYVAVAVLAGLGTRFAGAQGRPLLVGFAAETERVEENARDKLARKNLDLIVANEVSQGFAGDENRVVVLGRDGGRAELAGTKRAVADALWDRIRALL